MTLLLGEWRKRKVRPIPGNAPHDRPVSRGFISSKSICDDSLRTTRFPQLQRTRRGPRRAFSEAWRNLSPRCGFKTKPEPGSPASRRSAPTQVEERAGRIALFSSSAMSSGRLFLDRVGRHQSPSPLHRRAQTNMHLIPNRRKQDISTLQGIGHFYFALTFVVFLFDSRLKNGDTLLNPGFRKLYFRQIYLEEIQYADSSPPLFFASWPFCPGLP
jgi:hypothetical protein